MTNKEAIIHGEEQLKIFGGEHREFIEMAIKALEQDSCEDCVDRNHVIATISHHHFDKDKDNFDLLVHNLCKEVKELPPATLAHGACKDCKYNIKDGKTTEMCDIGHRFCMREPSTFCCSDFEKRGNSDGRN